MEVESTSVPHSRHSINYLFHIFASPLLFSSPLLCFGCANKKPTTIKTRRIIAAKTTTCIPFPTASNGEKSRQRFKSLAQDAVVFVAPIKQTNTPTHSSIYAMQHALSSHGWMQLIRFFRFFISGFFFFCDSAGVFCISYSFNSDLSLPIPHSL